MDAIIIKMVKLAFHSCCWIVFNSLKQRTSLRTVRHKLGYILYM